ncbi:hypothetical protein DNI29_11120 [Hymenobacter sediminis]|uniref:hypothetical protein n=1 Tax=Hymenobacter sediminis TaxID=2218621 RepID=UPI000DA6B9F3|nr:hypothetical protein [Hymenobacter sediminis]RPD47974.1 hypothetical protein DNI29_11120 [Hymenobacter sediminis]
MLEENSVSLFDGNTLELHYWFEDGTHTMDAVVQNRCEHEFLSFIKTISASLGAYVNIETEPLAEGGIRRWFKIVYDQENKKSTILAAVITALALNIFTTPIQKTIEKVVDNIFEDEELKTLEKDKLKLEIEKLRQETRESNAYYIQNNIIKKRRSNFYELLGNYPKVSKISLTLEDNSKRPLLPEKTIYRENFSEYILESSELEPIELDNETIEIISPVLKKGNYKWMGIYKDTPISFNMKSNEFKNLVQTGLIQFKNGTSINCLLVINRRLDNDGIERITSYDIIRVNKYFENSKPIETPEGKKHRQKKEADRQQLNLFASNND